MASTNAGVGLLDVADLFPADFLLQLFDHADDLDDRVVAEFDRVGDIVFLHFASSRLRSC